MDIRQVVDGVYRAESRRVLATLIRQLGDFDVVEEALHEAFVAAVEQWPVEGVPDNNEVIQVAARIPSAPLGTVEVRPCRDLEVDGVPHKASRKSR